MKKKNIVVPAVVTIVINSIILVVKKYSFDQALQIAEFINYTIISFGLFYFAYKETQQKAELITNIVYREYVIYLQIHNVGGKTARNVSIFPTFNEPFPYLTKLQGKDLGSILPNKYIEIPIFMKNFGEENKGKLISVWEDDENSSFKIGENLNFSIRYRDTRTFGMEAVEIEEMVSSAWMQGFSFFTPRQEKVENKNKESLTKIKESLTKISKSLNDINNNIKKDDIKFRLKDTSCDYLVFEKSNKDKLKIKYNKVKGVAFSNLALTRIFVQYETLDSVGNKIKPVDLKGLIEVELKGEDEKKIRDFFDDYKSIISIKFLNESGENAYGNDYPYFKKIDDINVKTKNDIITIIIEFT